ncbi:MAG TPA: FAD-binding oxidoreductase [bacterium]|uniref:Putative FAD-linked oxidoreductase n=1 Tax=candidate division TA06 bacterium ADurb.Bin417 TaxID=1852828 RepID=A0A1V5MGF9_UNCT6|nr:MAG: putative FAD-linked oxidoreductase [candidate division TA06 bacterium ADurb.Bin417]HNQ34949.1 FAD-binding oxidoreductase [bacterium]HNS48119.1 FAD-binding oxidoreductase [bacterium]
MIIYKNAPEEIAGYLEDSSNFRRGAADGLYLPENESEVVRVLTECSEAGQPLTISAGGTGTVAGRIPVGGRIISVERLDRILTIDPAAQRASLQAGVVVEKFLAAIDRVGRFYPPFPTERTAMISGNVSTNASGEYSYRFGPTRQYVNRLRLVLSDGEVIDLRRGEVRADANGRLEIGNKVIRIPDYRTPEIKCSAGYFSRPGLDAIDLFIGSEGTLAVFTEVEVKLIPALPPRMIMLLFLSDEARMLPLLEEIRGQRKLETLSLEYFDRHSLDFLVQDFPQIPAEARFAFYVEGLAGELETWLEILEKYPLVDTWVGADPAAYEKLIGFRHRLPENINNYFKTIKSLKVSLDFAVPGRHFHELYRFYQEMRSANRHLETVLFGHIGENHLHFNFFPKNEAEREEAYGLYREAALKVIALGGTIAAEHGIGKIKYQWLELMYGREGIAQMVAVKKVLDPAGILGLDTIFPRELVKG